MTKNRTSQRIQRRAAAFFEFGLPFPPWMAYSFDFNHPMMSPAFRVLLVSIVLPACASNGPVDQKNVIKRYKMDVPQSTSPKRTGYIRSPYAPEQGLIDVRGIKPGTRLLDPYTRQIFVLSGSGESGIPIE